MQALFVSITEVMSYLIDYVGTWIEAIMDEPILLLLCFVLPLVGIGLGILKRLLRTRA